MMKGVTGVPIIMHLELVLIFVSYCNCFHVVTPLYQRLLTLGFVLWYTMYVLGRQANLKERSLFILVC